MTRSADALQRRAVKRSRTMDEQEVADSSSNSNNNNNNKKSTEVKAALTEPGAWKCKGCGNHNFASRYICNSKTCNEAKPDSAMQEGQKSRHGGLGPSSWSTQSHAKHRTTTGSNKKPRRHDPDTSKFIDWTKPQASSSQVENNQMLRKRYKAEDPTLEGEELERAKLLVARDERKQQKKKKKHDMKSNPDTFARNSEENVSNEDNNGKDAEPENKEEKPIATLSKKEQQKANKALMTLLEETKGEGMEEAEAARAKELLARKANKILMKRFEKTKGEGMAEEDVTRAKQMLARKERKHQQRAREGNRKQ